MAKHAILAANHALWHAKRSIVSSPTADESRGLTEQEALEALKSLLIGSSNSPAVASSSTPSSLDSEERSGVTGPLLEESDFRADTDASNLTHQEHDGFDLLQDLLVRPELAGFQQRLQAVEHQVTSLEQHIGQHSSEIIQLLVPIIQELITREIRDLKSEFREAVTNILEEVRSIEAQVEAERVLSVSVTAIPPTSE